MHVYNHISLRISFLSPLVDALIFENTMLVNFVFGIEIYINLCLLFQDGYRQLALLPCNALKGIIRVKFINEQVGTTIETKLLVVYTPYYSITKFKFIELK